MISLIRLDERMIHGQIAIKWSKHTGVDRIIVANDAAAANSIVQKSLMMAAPSTIKTAIKSIDDAIRLINDPRSDKLKILLIVADPADLLKLVEQVKEIPRINIGNYGRIAEKKGDLQRCAYGSNLYAYEDEAAIFAKIIQTGIECVYQTTPEDYPVPLANVAGQDFCHKWTNYLSQK